MRRSGRGTVIDSFRNGSGFDALMTGLARKAYLVEGGGSAAASSE